MQTTLKMTTGETKAAELVAEFVNEWGYKLGAVILPAETAGSFYALVARKMTTKPGFEQNELWGIHSYTSHDEALAACETFRAGWAA